MKSKSNSGNDPTVEFMLKEYDRIHVLWMDENHQAEQRVNFFLTITSAFLGALIVAPQVFDLPLQTVTYVSEGTLILLFLFGLTVLNRLNQRTVQIRAFRKSLGEIQNYFAGLDSEVVTYLERQKKIYFVQDYRNIFLRYIQKSFNGGLNDLMILSNSLICGGIVLIALSSAGYSFNLIAACTILTIIISERMLHVYSNFVVSKLRPWLFY